MKGSIFGIVALAVVAAATPGNGAVTIDFEDGSFSNVDPVGAVGTADGNTVTFSVGASAPGSGTGFVAEVGTPQTAFSPNDTPASAVAGDFFLTDELSGPSVSLNYYIKFNTAVLDLSLDLFDYRNETPNPGDTATLSVFSDASFSVLVGQDVFTIAGGEPDGNVASLSVLAPSLPIRSAELVFSAVDTGTGIDNISYSSAIPEPTTLIIWSLLGLGSWLGMRVWRRRGSPVGRQSWSPENRQAIHEIIARGVLD